MDDHILSLEPSRFFSDPAVVESFLCPICLSVLTDPVTTP
jgi:hypothetical protein